MQTDFISKTWYEKMMFHTTPLLAYQEDADFEVWRKQVRKKITELLGDMPSIDSPQATCIEKSKHRHYQKISFTLSIEDDAFPCALVLPLWASKEKRAPVIVCQQGHETGMHASLGEAENKIDIRMRQDNMDFALQAVEHGFAALLVEMRFMGERRFEAEKEKNIISCYRPTMAALLQGKTTIGLRVADLRAAVSVINQFADSGVQTKPVICLGHSGGGTATFFAGCIDEKIDAVVISCALCDFEYSILQTEHCSCNYIPGLMKYLNMSDMAAAFYPRPIISLGGLYDDIFKIEGIESTFEKINHIYQNNGAPNRCALIKGNGGHVFFKEQAWPEIERIYNAMVQKGGEANG